MPGKFVEPDENTIPLDVVHSKDLGGYMADVPEPVRRWLAVNGFTAQLGQTVVIPDTAGKPARVAVGWGDAKTRARGRLHMGGVALTLPKGSYRIASGLKDTDLQEAALAWLLSAYVFDRYKSKSAPKARLVASDCVDVARLEAIVAGDFLTRDLINTPTSDMGPENLEQAIRDLSAQHGAKVTVIVGDDLLAQNFPMIHAVGRASDQAPRLVDLVWGNADDPKVTLVGKGVCFDTGGLNIKPGSSMGLMKKDMGGAATVLGLAHMIMTLGLRVRLRVLVPAVENSISAGAFRPQDVLTSRKGLTVEVNNTDAEGRLVLADALALADEEAPDLLVCKATLTGAARVALGPDLPPFFTDDNGLAHDILRASRKTFDPLWRMPFWEPYEADIEPDIADLDNAPSGGFGGAITAALFLRRFVDYAGSFVHLDIYGWAPHAKLARTKGGACLSARAMLEVIEQRFAK